MIEGYKLSPQQERIWVLQQATNGAFYKSLCLVSIQGKISRKVIEEAFNRIIARHEILRTRFIFEHNGEPSGNLPLQVIDEHGAVHVEEYDYRNLERARQNLAMNDLYFGQLNQEFDGQTQSPLQVAWIATSETRHHLLICLPSIYGDLKAIVNVLQEFALDQDGLTVRQEPPLAQTQYADVAEAFNYLINAEAAKPANAYWRKKVHGHDGGNRLPLKSKAPHRSFGSIAVVTRDLTQRLKDRLEKLALVSESFLAEILLTCWMILIWRLTGETEVRVGTLYEGRTFDHSERAVGPFARYLPLELRLDARFNGLESLKQVRNLAREFGQWQNYFRWDAIAGEATDKTEPVFCSVCFDFQTLDALFKAGLDLSVEKVFSCLDRFDLKLSCLKIAETLTTQFYYDSAVFQPDAVNRIAGQYLVLVESLVENPQQPIGQLSLLTVSEREQLAVSWNQTRQDFGEFRCVHALFEQKAEEVANAVAVEFSGEHLSYRELNKRANCLANYLIHCGVGTEVRVAISMSRGLDLMVALLAVLKTGGVYVPLDPTYPTERLSYMLDNSGAAVILTQNKIRDRTPRTLARCIEVDTQWTSISAYSSANPPVKPSGADLAYIIYTSGSTGRPKGVMVTHAGLANYVCWAAETYRIANCSGSVVHSSVSFDLTVTGLYVPLLWGAAVRLAEEGGSLSALVGAVEICDAKSLVKLTPSQLQVMRTELGKRGASGGEVLVIGGEALKWEDLEYWGEQAPETRLINEYGPTETVVGCCVYEAQWKKEHSGSVPIGLPIANTQAYVMDRRGELVGLEMTGELYIGGDGVARGYQQEPAQTAERFVPDDLSGESGRLLYRSGDQVRRRENGELEYLGRFDEQLKVRGYRIEPGEIEAVLLEHPGVKGSVVKSLEDANRGQRLVAYVVPVKSEFNLESKELREYVARRLPAYMVPSGYMMVTYLPLTANGKLDREALPEWEEERVGAVKDERQMTAVEELIAGIWSEVLKLDNVTRGEDFFELGGHSLLATQVVSRIREVLGVELPLRTIFEQVTVVKLAQAVEQQRLAGGDTLAPPIKSVNRAGDLPLSYAQQRLWFLQQLEPESAAYNVPRAVRLRGVLSLSATQQSLAEIVRRHAVLRTRLMATATETVQQIEEPGDVEMGFYDLSGLRETLREQQAREIVRQDGRRPFDLARGPLWRAAVVKLASQDHILMLNTHHVVSDGWSANILVKEYTGNYERYVEGEKTGQDELPIQYADYAVWQREWLQGEVLATQLAYWKRQLTGAPLLELPTDRSRSPVGRGQGANLVSSLSATTMRGLKELSQREGVTLFMTLLAGFQIVLSRYVMQDDVVVGTDVANRNQLETEVLIGFFVNQLILRTNLSGNPSFRESLRRVRKTVLEAFEHQDVPFEKIVEELGRVYPSDRAPLFRIKIVLQNAERETHRMSGLTGQGFDASNATSKFDLLLNIIETDDELICINEYDSDLFDVSTMRSFMRFYEAALTTVAEQGHLLDLPKSDLVIRIEECALRLLAETTEVPAYVKRNSRRRAGLHS